MNLSYLECRSINLILDKHVNYEFKKAFCSWFDSYCTNYLDLSNKSNLVHKIYGLCFNFSGNQYYLNKRTFKIILKKIILTGFKVNIDMDINIVNNNCKFFLKILKKYPFITVNLNSPTNISCNNNFLNISKITIDKLINLNVILKFSGDIDFWLKTNIFESVNLNSKSFSIIPKKTSPSYIDVIENEACYNKIIFTIDSDGNIFPCTGLKEIQQFAIGNIFESRPFFESKIDIKELYYKGPSLTSKFKSNQIVKDELPMICKLHQTYLCNKI